MSINFSSDSETEFQKTVSENPSTASDILTAEKEYEIDRCVDWCVQNGIKNLALHFPDDLLKDAKTVSELLEKRFDGSVYILADTTFSSCCVDEVAASHVNADGIVHFGSACLSSTQRLPVLYIFPKLQFDLTNDLEKIQDTLSNKDQKTVVMYDVGYAYVIDKLCCALQENYKNLIISQLIMPTGATFGNLNKNLISDENGSNDYNKYTVGCRTFVLPEKSELKDYNVLFIGNEGSTLSNLIININQCQFVCYNPISKVTNTVPLATKQLFRRNYLIEKAKDANRVAVLVGTLGVTQYKETIEYIRNLAKCCGKRVYTISVGKPNPAKLANFPEIDIFVIVACPETSLIDSKEFFRPIITPFEFEVACNANRKWNAEFITDFKQILPGGRNYVQMSRDQESVGVSLITGGIQELGAHSFSKSDTSELTVSKCNNEISSLHIFGAGEFLANRTWKGLEKDLGSSVANLEEGRKGIASAYESENV